MKPPSVVRRALGPLALTFCCYWRVCAGRTRRRGDGGTNGAAGTTGAPDDRAAGDRTTGATGSRHDRRGGHHRRRRNDRRRGHDRARRNDRRRGDHRLRRAGGTTGAAGRGGTTGSRRHHRRGRHHRQRRDRRGRTEAARAAAPRERPARRLGNGRQSSGTCPATALKPGDSNKTVMVGTLNRTYVLHIPTGYTGTKPLPLVIDFHPLGGTGSGQEGSNGWKAKADSVGFIMAYPNSYNSNNSWNVGFCCQDAQKNQIDDVAFTKAMIQQIERVACVDTKRVYATGCSNGGGMTYKAACDLADMIAGAAPVDFRCVYGGSTTSPSCEGCKPSRPISITHFDNTGDTALVPYNGGTTSFAADCPPTSPAWGWPSRARRPTSRRGRRSTDARDRRRRLSGHSACTTNTSCQDGAQVTMCVQQGGSHCGNYTSLGIVDIAWEMFQKQALP